MNKIFDYNNKFFQVLNKVVDCFYISILWLISCIPIITIGTATTALYDTVHRVLRRGEGYVWRTYWHSFKSNFRQTVKIWMIMLVLFAVLLFDRQIMKSFLEQGSALGAFYYFFYILILFEYIWAIYTFCYSARFELPMKAVMKNGAILLAVKLPWSLLILVIFIAAVIIVPFMPVMLFLFPAVVALLYELILEKIFRQFMKPEDLEREIHRDWEDHE